MENVKKIVCPVLGGKAKCKPTAFYIASEKYIEFRVCYPRVTDPMLKSPALSNPNSML